MWEEVVGGLDEIMIGKRAVPSRAYASWFNFKGRDQQRPVGTLSGGERNRVHLAKLLRGGCNLLLLDEPTNDLDVDTLRSLEDALVDFAGCAVVVSHDRWFLDRIATHILAFEGDSQVVWFQGNYQDYEADPPPPHRRRSRPPPPDQVPEAGEGLNTGPSGNTLMKHAHRNPARRPAGRGRPRSPRAAGCGAGGAGVARRATSRSGKLLVERGLITQKQLTLVLERSDKRPRLGEVLVRNGSITRERLEEALAEQQRVAARSGEVLVQMGTRHRRDDAPGARHAAQRGRTSTSTGWTWIGRWHA